MAPPFTLSSEDKKLLEKIQQSSEERVSKDEVNDFNKTYVFGNSGKHTELVPIKMRDCTMGHIAKLALKLHTVNKSGFPLPDALDRALYSLTNNFNAKLGVEEPRISDWYNQNISLIHQADYGLTINERMNFEKITERLFETSKDLREARIHREH